jgi:hypothetical protein
MCLSAEQRVTTSQQTTTSSDKLSLYISHCSHHACWPVPAPFWHFMTRGIRSSEYDAALLCQRNAYCLHLRRLRRLETSKDEGNTFLRNIGKCSPSDAVTSHNNQFLYHTTVKMPKLTFRDTLFTTVNICSHLLLKAKPPGWRTTPCRLTVTACSASAPVLNIWRNAMRFWQGTYLTWRLLTLFTCHNMLLTSRKGLQHQQSDWR